jgi:hypothetical protein
MILKTPRKPSAFSVNSRPISLISCSIFDEWTNQWNIKGIPIVLVFDREGKLLRRFDRDDRDRQFKYSDVDRFLAELVSK